MLRESGVLLLDLVHVAQFDMFTHICCVGVKRHICCVGVKRHVCCVGVKRFESTPPRLRGGRRAHVVSLRDRACGDLRTVMDSRLDEATNQGFQKLGWKEMTRDQIEEAIKKITQSALKLPDGEISSTSNLRDLPGVESIKILRIIANIEKKFGIRLDDQIVFQVSSIHELAGEVAKLVGAQEPQ